MGTIYAVPRIPRSIVHRPRLSMALDSDAPLVVVRGMAGSGKTTAVADWAEHHYSGGEQGAWLTLDASTGERTVFWNALLHQLKDADLLPTEGVLRHSLDSLTTLPDLRRTLVRGFSQLDQQLLLIVDDLHFAEDDVLDDLVAIVTACPRIRVVAVTRRRSILDEERVTVALGPARIPSRDLLLTLDETRELVAALKIPDGDGSVSETVWKVSGGVPLVARGVLVVADRSSFDMTPETIREHISTVGTKALGNVWAMQASDDPEVDALLRLSIADALTIELAQTLSGSDDAGRLLNSVEGLGLGWWTSADEGAVFSFTTEIREGLRRELRRRFPREIAGLRALVMRWDLDHGYEIQALQHSLALRDYAFANDILMRSYVRLLPHRTILLEELGALNRRTLSRQPLLAMLYALTLNAAGHRVRAFEAFAIAVVAVRTVASSVDPAHRVVLATIESAALRVTGRFSRSVKAAERTVGILRELTPEQTDMLSPIRATVLGHTGLSFFYGGQRERAHDLFVASQDSVEPLGRFHGLALTAGSFALRGHLPEAQELVDEVRAGEWPVRFIEGYNGAMYQVAAGLLAIEGGDFERADAHIDVMAPHLETIEHWPVLMYVRALAEMGRGRALAGATGLEMALHRGARPSVAEGTKVLLDATLANLLMAAGHSARADATLARHPAGSLALASSRARLQLILGNADAAARELSGSPPDEPRQLAESLLLTAAARLRAGRIDEAVTTVERGLSILRDRRLTTPYRLLPATDATALVEFVASSERLASFRPFVADLAAVPTFMPASPRAVQLTERELVVLQRLSGRASLSEIAAELFVSLNTVKSQVRSVYKKLGVSSRESAVVEAGRLGLLDP